MQVSVTIDDRAVQALFRRVPGQVDQALRGGMEDATTYLLARVRQYPQQRARSSYRRTHTLSNSWSKRIQGSGGNITGIVGSNGNIAPYNRLVQDASMQARVHRGRWRQHTVQAISESARPAIDRMFAARVDAALR